MENNEDGIVDVYETKSYNIIANCLCCYNHAH